jgi:hypothetical protein
MKRILVLMLVLGLASVAYAEIVASLELSINGVKNGAGVLQEITIAPCDTLLIDVYNNSPGPISDQFWLGIQVGQLPSSADSDKGEWYRGSATIPYDVNDGHNRSAGNAATFTDGGYGINWFSFDTGLYGMEPGQYPVAGTWFTDIFHCLGPGYVYINLYDTSGYILEDSILVHQIPEPVTLALLGLGGLLLRRRK